MHKSLSGVEGDAQKVREMGGARELIDWSKSELADCKVPLFTCHQLLTHLRHSPQPIATRYLNWCQPHHRLGQVMWS